MPNLDLHGLGDWVVSQKIYSKNLKRRLELHVCYSIAKLILPDFLQNDS